MNVNDPKLATMDALATKEYRVRVTAAMVNEYKVWAPTARDAAERVRNGHGRLVQKTQPEVVDVQVSEPQGALTQQDALRQARVIQNAQTQKDPKQQSFQDILDKK